MKWNECFVGKIVKYNDNGEMKYVTIKGLEYNSDREICLSVDVPSEFLRFPVSIQVMPSELMIIDE
jgi:hypothetical protein